MDRTLNIIEPEQPGQGGHRAFWRRLTATRHVWTIGGILLALIVVAASIEESSSHTPLVGDRIAGWMDTSLAHPASPDASALAVFEQRRAAATMSSSLEDNATRDTVTAEANPAPVTGVVSGPMMAQTASLTIVPTNYDQAAGAVSALVASRGGYIQKLDSEAQPDSSRQVSITLRVPAKQMDSFLADLRKLGSVKAESRENDEVTDQYVDLDARLQNAQAGEQRLIQLLATRTGKVEDVLDAERELTRVRGEVESMTGERNLLLHRVDYATVDLQLQEQYRAQFGSGAPAGSVHNALVEGFRNLEAGAIGALLFVLAYGPAVMFWLAVFGAPLWFAWRAMRRRFATSR
jgi:Domain of unknown function (DUF4349)